MVRRKRQVGRQSGGESDTTIPLDKDNKSSGGSGINIVSSEKLIIPSNKPTTTTTPISTTSPTTNSTNATTNTSTTNTSTNTTTSTTPTPLPKITNPSTTTSI